MKTKLLTGLFCREGVGLLPTFTAFLWLAFTLSASATSLQLDFTVPSSFNESNRQAVLEWNAEPAGTYLVQSATNLSPGTEWKTEEPVRATAVGPIKWMAPEALRTQKYYRLILPQPEVFSVEPSFVNSDDPGALFYLIGQMLPTNGSVVINGQNFSVTSFDTNGSWIALSLNGLPPGTPIFGNLLVLDNVSNIVTTLPLQNPVLYGTELTAEQLQGPPDQLPASPDALLGAWLTKKGYQYYKAQSDMTAAGAQTNPYFVENSNVGETPTTRADYRGHVTVLKSHADGPPDSTGRSSYHRGHVTVLKAHAADPSGSSVERHRGHVTVLKSSDSGSIGGITGGAIAGIVVAALSSGELQAEEIDLAIPGRGLDFAWTRTYRSRTETTTAQGAGWDFCYNVSATPQPDGTVVLRPGNGRADTFYPNGTNGWTRDEYFLVIRDVDQDGSPDEVIFPDGGKWTLHPPGPAFAGKLAQIVDRNNNTIRCEYDNDTGRLLQVVDTLDRTNTVAYTAKGLIESVTDFSGRTVRYEYDSGADLIACISPAVIGTPNGNDFPGGKTNRYAYSSGNLEQRLNHNLVSIIDPKGQVCLEVTYQATNNPASLDFDAVSSLLRGVDKKDIRRGMVIARPSNSFATVQTIVNDYVGNVTEYLFDSRHRCVSVREFTGRANPALPTTATENRPSGKLRPEDPDYFETRWEWNADSLCTREIRPDGGSTEISHQRAFNQNSSRSNNTKAAPHNGDVRVIRERASSAVDTDGDGAPDTTELAWYFEYDPRFGSPAASYGKKIYVGNLPFSPSEAAGRKGWDGKVKGASVDSARIIMDRDSGRSKGFGFVTSTTDPRGNSSTCDYDEQGNARRITFKAKEGATLTRAFDFAYNSHGQLTAITNAPDAYGDRSVDTYSYFTSGAQRGMVEVMMAIAVTGGLSLTTAFEYDDRGNVTRVVDPRGNDLLFTYNALDQCVARQTQQSSFGERVKTVFHYDANDNVVRCDLENRDETGALVAANPQWTTLFEHDALDRLTGIVEEISEGGGLPGSYATNRFVYDANDNLTEVRSPLAVSGADLPNTVAFEYDERGLLFREIGAPGTSVQSTTQCDYDANGNVTRVSEGLEGVPSITTLEYDGFAGASLKKVLGTFTLVGCGLKKFDWSPNLEGGKEGLAWVETVWNKQCVEKDTTVRVSKITDPLGNITKFHYDPNSNLKVVRHFGETNDAPGSAGNRLLAETRYECDSLDQLVRSRVSFFDIFTEVSISDGQSDTTFTYAPNGACTSVTDDNGHTSRFTYDGLGRLAAVTDPKTNVVQFAYDACDNLTNVISSARSEVNQAVQQFRTVHTYDALNRCISSADNVGNTNRYAYDSRGNVVSHLDPREHESFAVFDGLGRCVATTNYVGKERGITINTSHVEYDTNSRRTAATDSNGNSTTYAYDSLDRCVTVTEADGTSSSLVWSPRSNLLRQQDANGTVITNIYDLLDRCVSRVITPGPTVAPTTTFETFAYDGLSRCVAASNDVSLATFAYDSLGNLLHTTQDGLTTASTYDAVGNLLSLTYPGGRVVTYTYDALDQATSLSSGAGGLPPTLLAQYAYEGPGRVGRVTRANGVSTRLQWNGLVNPANAVGDFGWQQISRVTHAKVAGNVLVDQRTLQQDRNQNTISRVRTPGTIIPGETITLNYDALDRLTNFVRVSGSPDDVTRDYVLDGNGNRQVVLSNSVAQLYVMDNSSPVPADFQMNQYTVTPFGAQEYDQNGNLTLRTGVLGPVFYYYDYADRLVQANGLNGEGAVVVVASYAYDALGRRIGKIVNPGPVQTVIQYVVCAGGAALEERENGILTRTYVRPEVGDEVLVAFDQAGQPQYFHHDDLGNTLALTDASGAVVERYDYDDYGKVTFLTSDGLPTSATSSAVGNPYCWGGLRLDAETGLYNDDGGSYYEPQTGRCITVPWIASNPSIHHGTSGGNNPWSGGASPELKASDGKKHFEVTAKWQARGMSKGTVKFFNEAKGFGFVADGGVNVKLIVPVAMDKGLRFAIRGGSASGTKAQDHNSSRSNKTSSRIAGPGGGEIRVKIVAKI